jgi:hypothetical protein
MLLLNSEDPLRKENAFKNGKMEIIKIGNSSDVKRREIQINASHGYLIVEEIFEYPFYNFISAEDQMHSEFKQYGEPMIDKNGTNLTEYYKANRETYDKICETLKIKCLKYLPDLIAEVGKIGDECSALVYKNQLLKNELDDNKEKLLLLEKQYDIKQYKNVIIKLLRYILNDDNVNKEKTIVDALKLFEEV